FGNYISGVDYEGHKSAHILPDFFSTSTHLRYNSSKKRLEGKIDAVIIGSGAAGSVVAHELQQAGLKVLILEKGPLVIPGAINTENNMRFCESKSMRLTENGSLALL